MTKAEECVSYVYVAGAGFRALCVAERCVRLAGFQSWPVWPCRFTSVCTLLVTAGIHANPVCYGSSLEGAVLGCCWLWVFFLCPPACRAPVHCSGGSCVNAPNSMHCKTKKRCVRHRNFYVLYRHPCVLIGTDGQTGGLRKSNGSF